jgi:anti-sigma-K factor RskA
MAWVAGAAAAGLVVGVAGTRLLEREEAPPAAVTVASTSLDTLDTQQARGSAEVVSHDGRLDLAVRTDPIDAEDGYLEVWLINEDLQRMVSIGVLRPGETDQSFAIPRDLIDQGYVIVDISREGFDSAPEHSGDSVVRGTLAT